MKIEVRLFAALAETANSPQLQVELPDGATGRELLAQLEAQWPQFQGRLGHVRVAVDHAFVELDAALPDGAEIALIPPVSGGAESTVHIELTESELSLDDAQQFVASPTCGALVYFVGTVRNEHHGREVLRLEYSAYAQMAQAQMRTIAETLQQRWQVQRVAILHRLGVLEIGEASIVIALSLPHRKQSFEALQYSIDTFKEVVPIWKKETFADGESVWVEGS